MIATYKNVSIRIEKHAVIKEAAWRKRMSISELLGTFADELDKESKKVPGTQGV